MLTKQRYKKRYKRGNRRRRRTAMWWTLAVAAAICFLSVGSAVSAADKELEDGDITSAVESELWVDEAVDANKIDVSTSQGIVTLDGEVGNILAKERAQKIAETTVGVRGIVNLIEVEPAILRSDRELEQAVQDALLNNPATESYEVDVTVEGGTVTLTGTVESWQERDLCATVTKGVRGVRDVNNNVVVDYAVVRPDPEIKEEIEARLSNDVRVDDYLITVEVDDGDVVLSGTVGSLAEKNRARSDAWVAGVDAVDAAGLNIEWWARDDMRRKSVYTPRSDAEIKQAVKDAFLYDPRVISFNPEVDANAGTVTLTGVVDNLEAKRAAEEDARNVMGVWRVKNNLKVRPDVIPDDEELESRVSKALTEDPYVERYDIDVDASYGWITLTGTVNTSFEKHQAGRVARNVQGTTRVFNNIEYEYEWVWKPDWEIKADIEDGFFWSPFVDGDDITVTVDDGVATLTGTVDTWAERQDAEENAYEGGAKDVENNLTVTYEYYGPYGGYGPTTYPYRPYVY